MLIIIITTLHCGVFNGSRVFWKSVAEKAMTWLLNYLETTIMNHFVAIYNYLMLKYRMKNTHTDLVLYPTLCNGTTDRNNHCQEKVFIATKLSH